MRERPLEFKSILAALVTLILIFCLSTPINAQVAGAILTGTVMDSSRSGIPKAKVTITNVATGIATTVEADSAGIYTAPNLTAGTYDVSIEAAGFSTEIQRGVTLTVGAKQVLDIPMTRRELAQTINVTASAPTVELESSAISAVVNSTTVRELPLNGRAWTTWRISSRASLELRLNFHLLRDRIEDRVALEPRSAFPEAALSKIITGLMESASMTILTAGLEVCLAETWELTLYRNFRS